MRAGVIVGVVLLVALAGLPAAHAARGGSVLYGGSVAVGCDWSVHCTAFKNTCLPDLAISDGVDSSIVDVPASFRNTTRTFRPTAPSSDTSSRATFVYYDSVCRVIPGGVGIFPGVRMGTSYQTRVPSAARWMSVHAYRVNQVDWTLT